MYLLPLCSRLVFRSNPLVNFAMIMRFYCMPDFISTSLQRIYGISTRQYASVCEVVFMHHIDWCGLFVSKHLATPDTRAFSVAQTSTKRSMLLPTIFGFF